MEQDQAARIEIALWERTISPWVEVISDEVKRCHIEFGKGLLDIIDTFSQLLEPIELDELLQLWTNDNYPREFDQEGDFLIIRTRN